MSETKACTVCGVTFSRASKAYRPSPAAWAKQRVCSTSCAARARNAARRRTTDDDLEDFIAINPETGCHEWLGARSGAGYGQVWINGRRQYAHRRSWRRAHGPIPRGLFVLHRCDNPPCVREGHLFLGTALTNAQDCISKGRNSRGSAHPGAKLTEAVVLQGRQSGISPTEFARQNGVARDVAAKALKGRTWKHVPMPGPATGIACAAV